MTVPSSQLEASISVEGKFINGSSDERSNCQEVFPLTVSQEQNTDRNHPNILSKVYIGISSLLNEMHGRSIEANLFTNNAAIECIHNGRNSIIDHEYGHQDVASDSREIHCKPEKQVKKLKATTSHRKRKYNEIGRAMLLIVMVIVICYIPTLVEGLLWLQNIGNVVLDYVARISILINASCNAIILTGFSRDMKVSQRHCARSMAPNMILHLKKDCSDLASPTIYTLLKAARDR